MLAKYLLLLNKSQNKGFTLIELLVVLIIIGILTAISLPNFLGQTARAKQTEAKTTIGSINRAQVAYRIEGNSFAKNMDILALGLPTSTANYQYEIAVSGDGMTTTTTATAKDGALKGYSGGAVQYTNKANSSAIATVMCESIAPGTAVPAAPTLQSGANTPEVAATCAEGQEKL